MLEIEKRTPLDYTVMPWKNGLGSTTQIAIAPAHATFDDFDWRISCATVASNGAFSKFSGIDRSLLITAGAGLIIQENQSHLITLTTESRPYFFVGESDVDARLINGTVTDFNVMSRRRFCHHRVHKIHLDGGDAIIDCAAHQRTVLFHLAGEPIFYQNHLSFTAGDSLLLHNRSNHSQIYTISSHDAWLLMVEIHYHGV